MNNQLICIAGPCVIEDQFDLVEFAGQLKNIAEKHNTDYVFKASFEKANRTSVSSHAGPGIEKGLEVLAKVKSVNSVRICTDVHEVWQVQEVAKVADIIQIPAFLCRQTKLIIAAAETGKIVNLKKGQFIAPKEMKNVLDKVQSISGSKAMITERGYSFGYNNLIVDMRSIVIMKKFNVPIIIDGTHSTQLPGGSGSSSTGEKAFAKYLSRAAVSCNADGLFLEVHPFPEKAYSDKDTQISIEEFEKILDDCTKIKKAINNE